MYYLIAAAVVALIASGITAYSSYQQGQAAKDASEYNAKVAEYNAEVERNNAFQAQQEAEYAAERQKERGEALLARQRVLFAKSGVQMEGTPILTITDTAGDIALDRETILYKGRIQASQNYSQSALDVMGANIERLKGRSYGRAGTYGAVSSILSGIGQAAYYGSGNTSTKVRSQ